MSSHGPYDAYEAGYRPNDKKGKKMIADYFSLLSSDGSKILEFVQEEGNLFFISTRNTDGMEILSEVEIDIVKVKHLLDFLLEEINKK